MINLIGKSTIHPVLFFSGKICGYITWIFLGLKLLSTDLSVISVCDILLYIILSMILILIIFSLINLGRSDRLGLPLEQTEFRQNGLYKFSRNPMYLGFDLLTLFAIISIHSYPITIIGLYSIVIYHFIILGEEKFLAQEFGSQYAEYKRKVRRYV